MKGAYWDPGGGALGWFIGLGNWYGWDCKKKPATLKKKGWWRDKLCGSYVCRSATRGRPPNLT